MQDNTPVISHSARPWAGLKIHTTPNHQTGRLHQSIKLSDGMVWYGMGVAPHLRVGQTPLLPEHNQTINHCCREREDLGNQQQQCRHPSPIPSTVVVTAGVAIQCPMVRLQFLVQVAPGIPTHTHTHFALLAEEEHYCCSSLDTPLRDPDIHSC